MTTTTKKRNMFSNILKSKNQEKKFWDWFKKNCDKFSQIRNLEVVKQEIIVNDILKHLHEYCDNLWVQIGGQSEDYLELIITADGNRDYFEKSKALVGKAPQIKNWKIISLMPRLNVENINYSDISISISDLAYSPVINFQDVTSIGIVIYIKDYENKHQSKNFEIAIHKFLDQIVGEECYGYVSYVDFENWQEGIEPNITELYNYVMTKKESYE